MVTIGKNASNESFGLQSNAMCLYLQEERRMSLPKYKVHDETSQVSSDLPFLKLRRVCFCTSNPFGRLYLCFSTPDPIVSVLRGTTINSVYNFIP